ncbi:MAG: hypothetical protein CVV04_03330 [Firmicutes bacterium HGW-Firmicutes-9]|jgi:hypothetical protein|nr:MAG: hypothetical protein CVV04_03330 [Firmicutes bacterium HGW-Firmicutes-9]
MRSVVRYIAIVVFLAASSLLLLGCSENAQTKAITDAVVAYTDYYIEVRNLSDQVREQSAQTDASAKSVNYIINVEIPDYTKIDVNQTGFILPEPSVSTRSASSYEQQATLALRQAMERYVMQNGADVYLILPVTFSVNAEGAGWTANMTSQSKLDIQHTIEDLIHGILLEMDGYSGNYQRMQVSSTLSELLKDAFGGIEYAKLITVNDITTREDGAFDAMISYPDAMFVYSALGGAYVSSYNQPFYGSERIVSLTTEGLNKVDLTSAPQSSATVRVSYDASSQQYTLLDDGGIASVVAEAKSQAESDAAAVVNSDWRVPPNEVPDSASILEGKSSGNQIVFKTGASLGKYFYVRFFAISGEDTSEEGTLTLGVFIVGGKSARVKLPKGYYRVECYVGESWYGLEHLFGTDTKTYNGGNAIQSRNGYINNITFE